MWVAGSRPDLAEVGRSMDQVVEAFIAVDMMDWWSNERVRGNIMEEVRQ
jgi:hypothetical protein